MKRILYILAAASLILSGCAESASLSTNYLAKKSFDSWVSVRSSQYPEYLWTRTLLGCYLLEDVPGTEDLQDAEKTPYLRVEYTIWALDGEPEATTEMSVAQQWGEYDETAYYGPAIWYRAEETLYPGYDEIIMGDGAGVSAMKVGGSRTFAIPGWLQGSTRYSTEEEYLAAETGTDYINRIKIVEQIEDIEKWEIDSLSRYIAQHTTMDPKDSLIYGLYFLQTSAPTTEEEFEDADEFSIYYIGRRLDGQVFDTNVADTAKMYGLYDYASESDDDDAYQPISVTWDEDPSEMTMGDDEDSMIYGFAYALNRMKTGEKATVIFYSGYGYSYSGSGTSIPAYCPLIFELQIVEDED